MVVLTTWEGPSLVLDASGQQVMSLDVTADHHGRVAAVNRVGSVVAIGEEPNRGDGTGMVQLWDLERRSIVGTIDVLADDLSFSADGTLLAVAQGNDATVWSVDDATPVSTLTGHLGSVWSVAFDPSAETVATTSQDGTVRLWNAETGAPRLVLPGHDIVSAGIAFVSDGTALVSGGGDGVARVWALDLGDLMGIAQDKLTRGLTEAECREYLHVASCPDS